jgi:ribosome-associated protein
MTPNDDPTQAVVDALEDIKGIDIRILDVRSLTTITDWMVFCTGTSSRHVKSLADSVIERSKAGRRRPIGVEGMAQADWVLVDLGDVVVHVMQAQARAHFQLEKLWDMAEPRGEASRLR